MRRTRRLHTVLLCFLELVQTSFSSKETSSTQSSQRSRAPSITFGFPQLPLDSGRLAATKMTSVNSDDSPSSQSPTTQRSKSGSKTIGSRHVHDLPAGYGPYAISGEGNAPSDDQSCSARIQDLQRTIDDLRAQQASYRDRLAQSRSSHLSGGGYDRPHFAPNGEDETEKGWKLEIKRWKRVNNRNGFSDIYDESEKIEDIRKREREIRSGGITSCIIIHLG